MSGRFKHIQVCYTCGSAPRIQSGNGAYSMWCECFQSRAAIGNTLDDLLKDWTKVRKERARRSMTIRRTPPAPEATR